MSRLVDRTGRPQSGVLPYAVIGIVTDNVDPDALGRIQVKFPTLPGEPTSYWLRQATPNGGKERGFYALPEVDDEVLVLFLQGSQDAGVIVGQLWNGTDKPPTESKDGYPGSGNAWGSKFGDAFSDGSSDTADNDRRLWRSRSGHLLIFDDTSGSETVQIWDKGHQLALVFDTSSNRILLTNGGGDIHIRASQDLYLEAGNDLKIYAANNIQGESGQNTELTAGMDYTLDAGMNVSESSGMDFSIEAGMNLKCKASMNMECEGQLNFSATGGIQASLEANAMAKVKGGIVMIN